MRSKLYKYFCVLTVVVAVFFCFNTIKYKNIKSRDDLQTIDSEIESAKINVHNNPKDKGFKQTLINLENFKNLMLTELIIPQNITVICSII